MWRSKKNKSSWPQLVSDKSEDEAEEIRTTVEIDTFRWFSTRLKYSSKKSIRVLFRYSNE